MEKLKEQLIKRKKWLDEMESVLLERLENVPEGQLRISNRKGIVQYYNRKNRSDRGGQYISKADMPFIIKLAQKEYDLDALQAIHKERRQIDLIIDSFSLRKAEDIYDELNEKRKQLVAPVIEPTAEFIDNWMKIPYKRMDFAPDVPEFYSNQGLRVRSKSEIIIANTFDEEHVAYKYECPLDLGRYGIFLPDFTILDPRTRKEIIWEHFGMMDDAGYYESAGKKLIIYERCGYYLGENLIVTWETKDYPLNGLAIKSKINRYLK